MIIERTKVLSALKQFSLTGNGIVIGSPGVGKTRLIIELSDELDSEGILNVFLPIDQLGDGTEQDMHDLLGLQGDLFDFLRQEKERLKCKQGVIFFDAFDAARSQATQQQFLHYIQKAVEDLNGTWNVIVTVRNYDAKKSDKLLKLFKADESVQQRDYTDTGIKSRHFVIPPLNDEELEQAFVQVPSLKSVYNSSLDTFQQLLHIPFYLWLMVSILETTEHTPDVSKFRSEVQLLNMFWEERIEKATARNVKEIILAKCADLMVRNHSLAIFAHQVGEVVESGIADSTLESLMSDEILVRTSFNGRKVSFSHNILFDYAVSVLLVDDDLKSFSRFISEDKSRVVFLRPSLVYFFTSLWYDSPKIFWSFFWTFMENPHSSINLLTRLIPCGVLVQEARDIADIFAQGHKWSTSSQRNYAVSMVSHALQAFNVNRDELWIEFFGEITQQIHNDFVLDISVTVSEILARAQAVGNHHMVVKCGSIGRQLLGWIWKERTSKANDALDQVGAHWVVPLVTKTYGTNVDSSRELLSVILGLTKKENFPIPYLYRLSSELNYILPYDADFIASLYFVAFEHEELSTDKTHMGGYVLSFTSTRRQDFELCQYLLIQFFSNFVRSAPVIATQTAIKCLSTFIYREHIVPYLKQDTTLEMYIEANMQIFQFNGKSAACLPDHSYVWADKKYTEQPLQMATHLYQYISDLTKEQFDAPQSVLDDILTAFGENAQCAFFWKGLLQVGKTNPLVFARKLYDMLIASPIQQADETIYEYCEFIKLGFIYLTSSERIKLEHSIMALADAEDNPERRELFERRMNQILSGLSIAQLKTETAKGRRTRLDEENQLVENKPLFSIQSWSQPLTEELWLAQQGVNTDLPAAQKWLEKIHSLKSFVDNPDETNQLVCRRVITTMEAALTELEETDLRNTDAATWRLMWSSLASSAEALSRHVEGLNSEQKSWLRNVLLICAEHPEPQFDEEYALSYTSPSWSPSPRTEAAIGLPRLVNNYKDEVILHSIDSLLKDPVPSVRFLAARGLLDLYSKATGFFWQSVNKLIKHEKNQVVRDAVLYDLAKIVHFDKVGTVDALSLAFPNPETERVPELAMNIIAWLAFIGESKWAKNFYEGMLGISESNVEQLRLAVFQALQYISPQFSTQSSAYVRDWLERAIIRAEELIKMRTSNKVGVVDINDIYAVINEIVMRLYFNIDGSNQPKLSQETRSYYYWTIDPLLNRIAKFASNPEYGFMFASTAHYFMQLLNGMIAHDPKGVLHLARIVGESSAPYGYSLDSMAIRDVVTMVEVLISDFKTEIHDDPAMNDLLALLDIFAKTGWTDAVRLVWRLEEIYR